MAHFLSGEWRSFVVNGTNGVPGGDDKFILNINDGGMIDPGTSSHGAKPVSGKATSNQSHHSIKIDKPSETKRYRGYLLVNGPQMLLVGFINRDPDDAAPPEGASEEEIASFFDQQQEVWIATKP